MDVEQVQPTVLPNEDGSIFNNLKVLNVGNGTLRVDKNGMSVAGTVIVDSEGLNSFNNFRSDTFFDGTNRAPASTTYEDIPGATLTAFTLTRQARILTYIRARMYHVDYNEDGLNYKVYTRLLDTFDDNVTDGISSGGNYVIDNIDFSGTSWSIHVSGMDLVSISNDLYVAGTHQFKAQYKVDGGTGALQELQIGYIILGI